MRMMLDQRFAAGGETELREAIDLYGDAILRYCHNLLCDYHEAQDAAQETFLRAYERRASFSGTSKLSSWLYAIAHHACIDAIRRRKRQRRAPERPRVPDAHISLELYEALQTLSPLDRALVYAHACEEMTFEELSPVLGKPAATLRKRYERARHRLADRLRGERAAEMMKGVSMG